jgi:hypothetical protein
MSYAISGNDHQVRIIVTEDRVALRICDADTILVIADPIGGAEHEIGRLRDYLADGRIERRAVVEVHGPLEFPIGAETPRDLRPTFTRVVEGNSILPFWYATETVAFGGGRCWGGIVDIALSSARLETVEFFLRGYLRRYLKE